MSSESEEHGRTTAAMFGPLKRALREHRYPVTDAELIEQYGGFELETADGSESFESVLHECEQSTFTEPWEIRDAIVSGLGDETAMHSDADESGEHGAVNRGDWSRLST